MASSFGINLLGYNSKNYEGLNSPFYGHAIVTQVYFSALQQYKLVAHENELRSSNCYQKIRDEINKRTNPLLGSVDWSLVLELCDELGRTDGFDFTATIYFTIAAIKNEGLAGFANGLELQVIAVDTFIRRDTFPPQKRVDLYRWMLGRISNELQSLKSTPLQLRDLYRCERACQRLNEIFTEVQPDHIPDLEAIGYVVFEHIDRLENTLSNKESRRDEGTSYRIRSNSDKVNITSSMVVKPNYEQQTITNQHKESKKDKYLRLRISFVAGLILGGGVVSCIQLLNTTHNQTISAVDSSLVNSVTKTHIDGRSLTFEEGKTLQEKFSTQQFADDKSVIVPLYLDQANAIVTRSEGRGLTEALSLIDTVQRLYPNDKSIAQVQKKYNDIEIQYNELFVTQYRRFNTARTRIANLQQAVKADNRANILRLSQDINEYAIGLSPIYGHLSYITEQLKQGDQVEAQKEWRRLNQEVQAVNFKVEQLHQRLF